MVDLEYRWGVGLRISVHYISYKRIQSGQCCLSLSSVDYCPLKGWNWGSILVRGWGRVWALGLESRAYGRTCGVRNLFCLDRELSPHPDT